VSEIQRTRQTSQAPCKSTGSLPESLRQQYLQSMGIQVWYDPSVVFQTGIGIQADSSSQPETAADISIVQKPESAEVKPYHPDNSISEENPFAALSIAIQQCELCELHATRKQAISGEGNPAADLLIITDAPVSGDTENEVLYMTRDKLMLQTMLQAINISLDSVYLTSLVKCRPPEQRAPYTSEMLCCDDHLSAQIKILQPKVIMVLGEKASQQLLVSQKTLTDLRLRHHQHLGVPVYASYHPHDLFNSSDIKRKVWQDLLQIKKQLI